MGGRCAEEIAHHFTHRHVRGFRVSTLGDFAACWRRKRFQMHSKQRRGSSRVVSYPKNYERFCDFRNFFQCIKSLRWA